MFSDKYIWEDGKLRATDDLGEWCAFVELCERRVARTLIGPAAVSTVFLALNHRFGPPDEKRAPIVFETMIFGATIPPGDMWRYTSLEAARAGHRKVVELVREFFPDAEPETTEFNLGDKPAGYEFESEKIRNAINRADRGLPPDEYV